MKFLTLLPVCLLFTIKNFAQFEDTWQPVAIYKQNGIKARVLMFDRARFKERAAVDFFDRDGYLTEHIQYDSTGKTQVFRETYLYDSLHKVTEQVTYNYRSFDSSQNKFVIGAVPRTTRMYNEYDSLNRIVKQIGKDSGGKIVLEITYTFNPFIKTWKYFRHDSLVSETTSYYDAPNIENRISKTFYIRADNENAAYTFWYKNHFDKAGKITRRRVKYEGADENKIFYKEIAYQYSLGGLLIKKLLSNRSDGENRLVGYLFDYKYW
ncbi:MAG: hypothetical protein V4685_05480 [Bacteroidota bacterium]